MTANDFNIDLLKIRLDVPLKSRINNDLRQLTLVSIPVQAKIKGKSFYTSDAKRFPVEDLLKVRIFSEGMIPEYQVICKPEDAQKAATLIEDAVRKYLEGVMNYYQIAEKAAKQPARLITKEAFMKELLKS